MNSIDPIIRLFLEEADQQGDKPAILFQDMRLTYAEVRLAVERLSAQWEAMGVSWDDTDLNMTAERLNLFSSYFGPICWTYLHRGIRFTGFFAPPAARPVGIIASSIGSAIATPLPRRKVRRFKGVRMSPWDGRSRGVAAIIR